MLLQQQLGVPAASCDLHVQPAWHAQLRRFLTRQALQGAQEEPGVLQALVWGVELEAVVRPDHWMSCMQVVGRASLH